MGGVNSPTEGYHETLTIFWLKMISCYLDQKKHTSLLEACNEFLTHDWASRDTPFLYYSRAIIFHRSKEHVDRTRQKEVTHLGSPNNP